MLPDERDLRSIVITTKLQIRIIWADSQRPYAAEEVNKRINGDWGCTQEGKWEDVIESDEIYENGGDGSDKIEW